MFAGTLGRSQFFVRSCTVAIAEAVLLSACFAVQYQALFGPPGEGRYRLAATAFLISGFFCFRRISFAVRRNRDAGGGDLLPGLYAIGLCAALFLQAQALIVWTVENPLTGTTYAGILGVILTGVWFYLLLAPSGEAQAVAPPSSRSRQDETLSAPSQLALAMEQAISGERPIPAMPAPARPQGFLQSARHAPPPPRQRGEFGRRGLR